MQTSDRNFVQPIPELSKYSPTYNLAVFMCTLIERWCIVKHSKLDGKPSFHKKGWKQGASKESCKKRKRSPFLSGATEVKDAYCNTLILMIVDYIALFQNM